MAQVRRLLLALALCCLLGGQAWSFTVTLRAEPFTDVLRLDFPDGPLPDYSVRRTGPRQITALFNGLQDDSLPQAPTLDGASLIESMQPVAKGYLITLKTRAFGLVSAPLRGQSRIEIHVFSDNVGAYWEAPAPKPPPVAAAAKRKTKAVQGRPAGQDLGQRQPPPRVPEAPQPQLAEPKPLLQQPEPQPQLAEPQQQQPQQPPQQQPEPQQPEPKPQLAEPQRQANATLAEPPARAAAEPLPATGPTLTLREALALALKNNQRLRASHSRAQGAEENVKSARGTLLPHLQLGGGLSMIRNPNNTSETDSSYINQRTRQYNLQASQNVFDGLVRFSTYSRAKLLSNRAVQERRKAELDTLEAVQREYYKLIRVRADITTYKASLARLVNQRNAALAFFNLEMAPRLSVLQVETALAQAEQKLSRAVSDEQIQLVKLNVLLGGNETVRHDFLGALPSHSYDQLPDFEECLGRAKTSLPEVAVARMDADIAQEELNISQGKNFPRVDATVGYTQQNTDYSSGYTPSTLDRKYYTLGLNFTWDVFSGGEQYYEVAAKRKLLQAAQEDLANMILVVHSYVRESYLNVGEARTQIRIAMLRAKEAREAYEQASMRFRSGIGTSLDVLDAHEKVTAAEAAHNQAQADYLMAQASLNRAMGVADVAALTRLETVQ